MPKFNHLPCDMKLYSPQEPNGRVFLQGDQWPGDAWSEVPGGEAAGKATGAQAVRDLESAQAQIEQLQDMFKAQEHDLAQTAKRAEDAEALLAGAEQAAADAEAARANAEAAAAEVTAQRDQLAQVEAQLRARAEKLEVDLAKANEKLAGLVTELDAANKRTADANDVIAAQDAEIKALKAEVAKVDPDGDGKVGGSKAKS